MNKQLFINTLVERAGRDEQSAAKSWTFLAEKCGWDDADLERYLSGEINAASGACDKADADVAVFEWRAGINRQGGH